MLKLGDSVLKPGGSLGDKLFELSRVVGKLGLGQRELFLGPLAVSDIVKAVDRSGYFALFVPERADINDHGDTGTVGPFYKDFRVMHRWYFAGDDQAHGALVVRQEGAVRPEQFVGSTKAL